ncbi:ester cyclase [Nitrososphaera sp. AFS]|jgi:steroid delta-isomerase-like uncharacterized protein|uniref:ester cyclase n=1 Tax=Nitrososphaera sp. AFS TaxID=2301191 RepID=UPI0013922EE3|nr:ester cyclase [Nitrososphaera sp. AFS]NAL77782.1 DUF4440 domain-containing protein [Nitrososphaera sp. AFS]
MSIIDTKQITRQFFDDAYNQGNLEGIDNLVTPSFVYHARGEDVQGIENFKKWIASDRAAFPDMRFTIVDSIAESNKIASTFVVEGTHKQEFRGIPATHKKFETVGITVFHFDGNKIKEAWVVVDGLSAALQIGVVRRV